MIPVDVLAVFNKNSGGGLRAEPQKPGRLLISSTFSRNSDKLCCRNTGDVIRNYGVVREVEKPSKNRKSPTAVECQRNEIPVDNLEFSTFSTGFSTRVFHMENGDKNREVFSFSRHNYFRQVSTKFYFFGTVHFAQWGIKRGKNEP
jgi:hypothetical protein